MPTATKKPAAKAKKTTKSTKKAPAKKAAAPREPKDLTPNMVKVLECLKDRSIKTASEISDKTGIVKGRRLPELVEKGYLKEMVPEEGKRGKRFQLTANGRKALDKALKG